VAHRCPPRSFACHAWDDELFALLAANQQDLWLSFIALSQHGGAATQGPATQGPTAQEPTTQGPKATAEGAATSATSVDGGGDEGTLPSLPSPPPPTPPSLAAATEKQQPSLAAQLASCVAACEEGVVVCIAGKGEPQDALRPLLRSWCLGPNPIPIPIPIPIPSPVPKPTPTPTPKPKPKPES